MTDAYGALLAGLATRPGQPVLIAGGLSHGLYAAALAPALDSGPVTYFDTDPRRLEIAAGYGARVVTDLHDTAREQFPVTVDTSADPARLAGVLRATAPGGHCHSVGIYFGDVALPLMSMYMNAVTFTIGRPDITPHAPAVLELIRCGRVDPMPVYSQTLGLDELPEALVSPYQPNPWCCGRRRRRTGHGHRDAGRRPRPLRRQGAQCPPWCSGASRIASQTLTTDAPTLTRYRSPTFDCFS